MKELVLSFERKPEKNARKIGAILVHGPRFFGGVRANQHAKQFKKRA